MSTSLQIIPSITSTSDTSTAALELVTATMSPTEADTNTPQENPSDTNLTLELLEDDEDANTLYSDNTEDESAPLLSLGRFKPRHIRHILGNEVVGLILMALSALGFSVMSVLVKFAGADFPSTQVVFVRSIVQMIGGILGCMHAGVEPWGPPTVKKTYLIGRGLAGAIGLGFYFFTVINMPLGDGTTIFFVGPAITAVAAHLFLGEPFGMIDGASVTSCLFGVILVSRPEFLFGPSSPDGDGHKYKYPLYIPATAAFAGACTSAIAYCLVRIVGKRVHFMVHVTYFGLMSTILSGILLCTWETPVPVSTWSIRDWILLLSLSLLAYMAQSFLNAGLQLANAGPATLMRNLDIVFAFIFGLVLFEERPFITSILGAAVILCTTGFVAMYKWWKSNTRS